MPDDTKVPAFESAVGLAPPDAVTVSKESLDAFNKDIVENNRSVLRFGNEAAQVASLFAKRAVRPDEIAALRRQMFNIVKNRLGDVDDVLAGTKNWTPTQTRLFALLTERVMPKLSNITVEDPTSKKMEDMSLEELEAIALGKRKAQAIDAIETRAVVADEVAEKRERREAKAEVIRELATVNAIDTAEKKYIAKKVGTPMAELEEQERKQKVKPQPFLTEEQRENHRRRTPRGSYIQHMLNRGHTMEEALEMEKARAEKISKTKQRWSQIVAERRARTMGLESAAAVANDIDNIRKQTLKEFRVSPLKGVRKQSTLVKRAEERKIKAERKKEREENPRVFVDPARLGITEEMLGGEKLRLRKLRELKPEAFGDAPKESNDE